MTITPKLFVLQIAVSLCFCLLGTAPHAMAAKSPSHQSLHDVYHANTEHELHVYRIYGKKPGKTMMLIGGIQGDEPGGYLTADLYADINLKQGNLIVVPRANFYSILLNQRNGMTGDMNRKFGEKEAEKKGMEQEIVSILKILIEEADCLLNLHEGSGYFNPDWIDDMENPNRYGQSIIFDASQYLLEDNQKEIDLNGLAARVLNKVNPQIDNPRYHFKANNHNTISDETAHKEQRKSATYYALTSANIPAFGVETSKSIRSNSKKVELQKLVVNSFMEEFKIIPETPGLHRETTKLNYVLIKVNNNLPFAVPNESDIQIDSGDEVVIIDILANTNRGLTADFQDMGSYNDNQLPFRIAKSTKVLIRKDAKTCGWINIVVGKKEDQGQPAATQLVAAEQKGTVKKQKSSPPVRKTTQPAPSDPSKLQAQKLLVNVNGDLEIIQEGKELRVPKGEVLILKGIQSNISKYDNKIFANLKGFAPPKSKNDGNDINFPIYPQQDLWVRYSENKKGIRYPVHATYKDKKIGVFWIKLQ